MGRIPFPVGKGGKNCDLTETKKKAIRPKRDPERTGDQLKKILVGHKTRSEEKTENYGKTIDTVTTNRKMRNKHRGTRGPRHALAKETHRVEKAKKG